MKPTEAVVYTPTPNPYGDLALEDSTSTLGECLHDITMRAIPDVEKNAMCNALLDAGALNNLIDIEIKVYVTGRGLHTLTAATCSSSESFNPITVLLWNCRRNLNWPRP